MSITVDFKSHVTVVETFVGVFVNPSDATATFDQLNESLALTGASAIPVTKHADFRKAMVAGAGTIDLAALPGVTPEEVVNGTGLKVQILKIRNLSSNANAIVVSKGASNGYGLVAAGTTWSVPLDPGQSTTFQLDDSAPDVAGGAKTIDLAGTASQVLEVQVVLG